MVFLATTLFGECVFTIGTEIGFWFRRAVVVPFVDCAAGVEAATGAVEVVFPASEIMTTGVVAEGALTLFGCAFGVATSVLPERARVRRAFWSSVS